MSIISSIVNAVKGAPATPVPAAPPAPPPAPAAPERERLSFEKAEPRPLSEAERLELRAKPAPAKGLRRFEQFGLIPIPHEAFDVRLRKADPEVIAKIEPALTQLAKEYQAGYDRLSNHDRHAVIAEVRRQQETAFQRGFKGAEELAAVHSSRENIEAKHREGLRGCRAAMRDAADRARAFIQPTISELEEAALKDSEKLEAIERASAESVGVELKPSYSLVCLGQLSWRMGEIFQGHSPADLLRAFLVKK